MEMPGRVFDASQSDKYGFGFNGKIEDTEVLSNGRWQDYGFRAYRNDIARFVRVDPLRQRWEPAPRKGRCDGSLTGVKSTLQRLPEALSAQRTGDHSAAQAAQP